MSFLLPSRNRRTVFGLYGVAAALLAGSLTLVAFQPAQAGDASSWGPSGYTGATDSAVTVNWDDSGSTPAADVVPRDSSQVIPHTGGKTYDDANQALSTAVQADFSHAQLTVSQTTGLVHQAVNLTVSGVTGMADSVAPAGFTVMQCWGSTTDPQPDPEHCQQGVGVVDGGSSSYVQGEYHISTGDAGLVAGGDLKANTVVGLSGTQDASTVTLVAQVSAGLSSGYEVATGAAGKIVFGTADGTTIATVPVKDGQATTTTAVHSGETLYNAAYIATPDENYLSAEATTSLGAPSTVELPAPDQYSVKWPAPAPLTSGGAGTNSAPNNGTVQESFQAVDGTYTSELDQYYTSTTTNEIGNLQNGSRTFDVQTGAESPGLGCGYRADQASTSVCWLVAVPANDTGVGAAGYGITSASPLTPSLWAQRMQVKLTFADVAPSCGAGSREISIGSDLLLGAVNSWIPALCTQAGVDLGYIQTEDASARAQYTEGNASLIFTSQPVDDTAGQTSTLYAPAGLTGVTIGVLSAKAQAGGVTGFSTVSGIKLNARLVAKLLTESYLYAIDVTSGSVWNKDIPWAKALPTNLATDPEFLALNPDLPSSLLGTDLIVTVTGSDATEAVWNWITSDPDARAFLDGCPDAASNDTVINPFYSTRTYAECPTNAADSAAQQLLEKDALAATADAERAPQTAANPNGTLLPSTYTDSVPSYPPVGGVFPQPGYYERPAVTDATGKVTQDSDSLANLHPGENTFDAIATDVLRGQEKSLDQWCVGSVMCPGVNGLSGTWENGAPPYQGVGVFGLTDGTAAALNQLPTTLLCDDSGSNCVGADNASLTAAAAKFTASSTDKHFQSLDAGSFAKNDWYADGAYPLTVPVYAEINTDGLSQATARDDAKVLSYISTTGQVQGYAIGDLPAGMAPLTGALVSQDDAAIATLSAITDPVSSSGSSPSSSPSSQPSSNQTPVSNTTPSDTPSGEVPPMSLVPVDSPAANPPGGSSPQVSPTSSPQALPGATAVTPALPAGVYPYAVGGGLAGALASGVAAPIVGRKRRGGR